MTWSRSISSRAVSGLGDSCPLRQRVGWLRATPSTWARLAPLPIALMRNSVRSWANANRAGATGASGEMRVAPPARDGPGAGADFADFPVTVDRVFFAAEPAGTAFIRLLRVTRSTFIWFRSDRRQGFSVHTTQHNCCARSRCLSAVAVALVGAFNPPNSLSPNRYQPSPPVARVPAGRTGPLVRRPRSAPSPGPVSQTSPRGP